MSSATIVSFIAAGLFLLIAIAVVQQTLDKIARKKRLLLNSLNTRIRNMEQMLKIFPAGFLSKELQLLIVKTLDDCYRQYLTIEPKNQDIARKQSSNAQQLQKAQNMPAVSTAVTLTDSIQINNVKTMLKALHAQIGNMRAEKQLNTEQYSLYNKQIRRLLVQSANDELIAPTQEAIAKGKLRLAIHYLTSARDKMQKENDEAYYQPLIAALNNRINELEQQANHSEEDNSTQNKLRTESNPQH